MKKKLPNILTISRILLTFCFIFFLTKAGIWPIVIAIVLFAMASLTDFYDGYFAKKYDLITNFGKIMDPLADKFLTLTAFYIFMHMHMVASWMFYAIFFREVLVTASRFLAMSQGRFLAAERAGKLKTVIQMNAIFAILGYLIFCQMEETPFYSGGLVVFWRHAIDLLMFLTVILTLFSGISYLWNNRKVFTSANFRKAAGSRK